MTLDELVSLAFFSFIAVLPLALVAVFRDTEGYSAFTSFPRLLIVPLTRGLSPQTVRSYRYAFVLMLRFLSERHKRAVVDLDLVHMSPQDLMALTIWKPTVVTASPRALRDWLRSIPLHASLPGRYASPDPRLDIPRESPAPLRGRSPTPGIPPSSRPVA